MFISVEGGEGVGKSDFTDKLTNYVKSHLSKQVFKTREPGGSPTSEKIRSIFNEPVAQDPLKNVTELFLISASRYQHVESQIRPRLKAGEWVICDRYIDSSRVYQGTLGGVEESVLEYIIKVSTNSLLPHLTFLLDCRPEVVSQRLRDRSQQQNSGASRYDEASLETHVQMRQAYLDLARKFPKRIRVINTERDRELILAEAIQVLKEYM